jgi:hypothetical protein
MSGRPNRLHIFVASSEYSVKTHMKTTLTDIFLKAITWNFIGFKAKRVEDIDAIDF